MVLKWREFYLHQKLSLQKLSKICISVTKIQYFLYPRTAGCSQKIIKVKKKRLDKTITALTKQFLPFAVPDPK